MYCTEVQQQAQHLLEDREHSVREWTQRLLRAVRADVGLDRARVQRDHHNTAAGSREPLAQLDCEQDVRQLTARVRRPEAVRAGLTHLSYT